MIPAILAPLLATMMMVGDFEPTASYRIRNVGGFTVLVSRKLGEHPEEKAAGIKELEKQIAEINRVVRGRALEELHRVRIWVDWDVNPDGGCVFHPSRQWLEEHGVNPDKAGCVEISNLRHFIDWSRDVQPCMILHEMAHAFDFRILDARDPRVSAAFRHAMEKKLYDSVDYGPGGKKRAYAALNEREYFAELTEAYFSHNDFYPFRHDELKEHDPEGYSALEVIWGKPKAPGNVRAPTPTPASAKRQP